MIFFGRNPDRDKLPWCYTIRGRSISWEYCDVPHCSKRPCQFNSTHTPTYMYFIQILDTDIISVHSHPAWASHSNATAAIPIPCQDTSVWQEAREAGESGAYPGRDVCTAWHSPMDGSVVHQRWVLCGHAGFLLLDRISRPLLPAQVCVCPFKNIILTY